MVATTAHQPPLRLTRRGRVVVLMFFVAMASLASAVLFATASRADNPPGPAPTVVVQPHDTLWAIATRISGRRDPYAVVAEIERLNGMADEIIQPGQTLILPRER